ncbi:class I SAM-dependent methyltransferase [Pseudomonas sp. DWP3-1-2]|uniref:class I SAM-dependent methyltransferase n=1 Tax=Pseudomonas sp. DWP3-1-2 TaxID=2804645 RepID=UPI003CFB612C
MAYIRREGSEGDSVGEHGQAADYAAQYTHDFVSRWDELIDWDKRAAGEGSFFTDLLRKWGAETVIDVSTGSGFHAVQLRRAGFNVLACDGSATMVERARSNVKARNLEIPVVQCEWQDLDYRRLGTFDAVLCLGSSLCHVFDQGERQRVLRRFRQLLKPGGLLLVDQRNFRAIRAGRYKASGRYYYCGRNAEVSLGQVSDQLCEFIYTFADGASWRLQVYPILPEALKGEIANAGFFWPRSFGDFRHVYDPMDCDFIIHMAIAK